MQLNIFDFFCLRWASRLTGGLYTTTADGGGSQGKGTAMCYVTSGLDLLAFKLLVCDKYLGAYIKCLLNIIP